MWNSLKFWSYFNSFLFSVNIVHVQENGIYFFIPNFIYHISWIVRQRIWSYSVSFLQIILLYCVYFHFFSLNYSLELCPFPLFFFKLFSCIVSISTFFFKLFSCIVSISTFFFHFVKLRNLRFHLIFLTKKMFTTKLLFDLINFFYCDSNLGKSASKIWIWFSVTQK